VWLGYYEAMTPGCDGANNTTWLMPDEETPQPDQDLRVSPAFGGQSRNEGKYSAGAPELLAEVWSDRGATNVARKLRVYRNAGVVECIAVYLDEREIEWHVRARKGFSLLAPDADGIFRSTVFPGLWLDSAALLTNDTSQVLAVLKKGLATSEHDAFVVALAERKRALDAKPPARE